MIRLILPICLLLSACAPGAVRDMPSRAATPAESRLPAMKTFAAPYPRPPARSNSDIRRDFLDLAFKLESGRELNRFTRFETPISIRITGDPPPTLRTDLGRLLQRLRREAGIDITRTDTGTAAITIEAMPGSEIRRYLPKAACFVVPNISSLAEYRRARYSRATDWGNLRSRERLTIFVPNDVSPQEIRDCLHEELAQAIGPLNDLYRLPDSVFNDDNVHTVLTGFDMLILRIHYAPDLKNGMTRDEVAARLPSILARLNPAGEGIAPRALPATPRDWIDAVETALGPGTKPAQRRDAARRAVRIAQSEGWTDHRRAFSHYALGRLTQGTDAEFALRQFRIADKVYSQRPDLELHRAFPASQLAAHAINQEDPEAALRLLHPYPEIARRHENATLLATLMMLQAEALDLAGRGNEARALRLDSLGWARYGYGADWVVRAKLSEIAAVNPLKRPNG